MPGSGCSGAGGGGSTGGPSPPPARLFPEDPGGSRWPGRSGNCWSRGRKRSRNRRWRNRKKSRSRSKDRSRSRGRNRSRNRSRSWRRDRSWSRSNSRTKTRRSSGSTGSMPGPAPARLPGSEELSRPQHRSRCLCPPLPACSPLLLAQSCLSFARISPYLAAAGAGGSLGGPAPAPRRSALHLCLGNTRGRRFIGAADKYCIGPELGGAGAPRHRPRHRARAGRGAGGGGASGAAPAAGGAAGRGGRGPANAARSRSGAPPGSTQHPASLKFHRQRSAKVYL